MKILYGTTNQAKYTSMKKITDLLGIELQSLQHIHQPIPVVEETGNHPLENARQKAIAYYQAFHRPVFSCDSGLYFEGLPDGLQPGVHVRRVQGVSLNDEEMIAYYANLAKQYEDQLIGCYHNAIYLILDEQHHYYDAGTSIRTTPFRLVHQPHHKRVKGLPLDCLSVNPSTGAYFYDEPHHSVETKMEEGFYAFFQQILENSKTNNN